MVENKRDVNATDGDGDAATAATVRGSQPSQSNLMYRNKKINSIGCPPRCWGPRVVEEVRNEGVLPPKKSLIWRPVFAGETPRESEPSPKSSRTRFHGVEPWCLSHHYRDRLYAVVHDLFSSISAQREQARLDKDAKQRAIRKAKKKATDWDGLEEEEEESESDSSSEKEVDQDRRTNALEACSGRLTNTPQSPPTDARARTCRYFPEVRTSSWMTIWSTMQAWRSPHYRLNHPARRSHQIGLDVALRIVYTTIELVVMPAACRRNDLSLQSTSTLPTTPDVAARRASVSSVRFPHRVHAGVQPAAPEIVSGERLLHADSRHPRPLRISQCTAHSQPRPTTPQTGRSTQLLQVRATNPPRCASRLACPGTRRIRAALGW
ncbi:hypothetical protein B0H14DRAFT_3629733 [Mycena olivaceomarginata]|nr:hypothetical protein B0H14DRAFT_3629733 [Mycena olivaceomarginata]